jgi:hypothetical protein
MRLALSVLSEAVSHFWQARKRRALREFTWSGTFAFVLAQTEKNERNCMNRSTKAALLSGLVFPGVGQWYERRRGLALLFAVPALVAGYVYLNHSLDEANAIAGQILSGAVALDPAAIAAKLENQPTPLSMTLCGVVFVACWVGSVIEALLRKQRP